ncbi:MAG: leucyl/phenylalanyl-tRNA--protein transferase, partial [Actinobacteria bacterium]|nr:leucyl/phenylalanyl-tRNA--protein transferase [Actinomycetota bacterium]
MPPADVADSDGIVGTGADLEPGTLLAAYRAGMFPMPIGSVMGWWSPDPRAVLPLDGLRVSRSLRRSCSRYEIRFDTAFARVVEACADPARPHGWITDDILAAYTRLHELGWAHSVEAWSVDDGELAGGLYGVHINGLFAGESMFH